MQNNSSILNLDSELKDDVFTPYNNEGNENLFEIKPKDANKENKQVDQKKENALEFKIDNVLLDVDAVIEETYKRKEKKSGPIKKLVLSPKKGGQPGSPVNALKENKDQIDVGKEDFFKDETTLDFNNASHVNQQPLTIKIQRIYELSFVKTKKELNQPKFIKEILFRGDYDIEETIPLSEEIKKFKSGNVQEAKINTVKKIKRRNEIMCIDLENFNQETFEYYTKKDYKDMKADRIYFDKYAKNKESNIMKLERMIDIKHAVEQEHPKIIQERAFLEIINDMKEFHSRINETKDLLKSTFKEVSLESFVIFYLLEKINEKTDEDPNSIFTFDKNKFIVKSAVVKDFINDYISKITEFYTQNTEDKLGQDYINFIALPIEFYIDFLMEQLKSFPFSEDYLARFHPNSYILMKNKFDEINNKNNIGKGKASEKNVIKDFEDDAYSPNENQGKRQTVNTKFASDLLNSNFQIFKDIYSLHKKLKKYFYVKVTDEFKSKFGWFSTGKNEEPPLYSLNYNLFSSLLLKIEKFYLDFNSACCTNFHNYLNKKFAHCFTCQSNICSNCLKFHSNHKIFDFANIYRNKISNIYGYDFELFPKKNLTNPEEQANYYKTISDIVINFIMKNIENPVLNPMSENNLMNMFNNKAFISIIDYFHALLIEFYFKEFVQIIKSKSYAAQIYSNYTKYNGYTDKIILTFNKILKENNINMSNIKSFLSQNTVYHKLILFKETSKFEKENRTIIEDCLVNKIACELNTSKVLVNSNKYNNNDIPQSNVDILVGQYNSPKNFYIRNFIMYKQPMMNKFFNNYLLYDELLKEKNITILENQIKNLYHDLFNTNSHEVINKHSVKYIIQILYKKSDITGLNSDLKSKTAVSLYKKDTNTIPDKLKIIKNILENHIINKSDKLKQSKAIKGTAMKKKKDYLTSYIHAPDIKDFPEELGTTARIMIKLLEQKSNLYNVDDEDKAMNYLDENFCIKNGFKEKLHLVLDYLNGLFDIIDHYGKVIYKKK